MLGLIKDRCAIRMIQDADFTEGKPRYTKEEIESLKQRFGTFVETSGVALEIPQIAKENADQGIVLYTGPDVKDIYVGDYVLFGGWDGTVVTLEGEGTLLLIREDWIKAKIETHDPSIPGLYFRGRVTKEEEEQRTEEIIRAIDWPAMITKDAMIKCIKDINKVYYKYDPYFTATHEQAIGLIVKQYEQNRIKLATSNKIHTRAQDTGGEV